MSSKKDEFKVGDLCVYFEIDSFLPMISAFEFLKTQGTKKMLVEGKEVEGYRLRTVRLRGQISQGLATPLDILPPDVAVIEGTDVTDLLGVYKYEPPIPAQLRGSFRGSFPSFIPKTDETRIQAYPEVLTRWKDLPFYVTEKLDGSSCTFFIKDGEFHVCSRNIDLLDDGRNIPWQLAKSMQIEEKLRRFSEERLALQAEVVGEAIQKNTLHLKKQELFFFNAYDYVAGRYLDYQEFVDTMQLLELPVVPIIETAYSLPPTVDQIVAYVIRKSQIYPEGWAEGFVFRPLRELQDPDLGRLSFKVINPEYLLKYGE